MPEDITGYDGETLGKVIDYHDDSGSYLGTAFIGIEEKGCLELLLIFWIITMLEVLK